MLFLRVRKTIVRAGTLDQPASSDHPEVRRKRHWQSFTFN